MKFRDTNAQQGAELELAPMVDVVFLLLIVTWQFARFERDMDISVPAAEETTDEPRNVGEIIVNVRTDGSIVLNGLEVSEEELLAKLKSISQAYPDQAVILRGSSEANFQAIINVL
ncbi:biopolymer transporter ExbD, partial [Verrucomicrobiales bacterium]|nr:biopolymer transporter ExbD [Verrucomicrobiales bacterium]